MKHTYEIDGKKYEFNDQGIRYEDRIFLKYVTLKNLTFHGEDDACITFNYGDKIVKIPYIPEEKETILPFVVEAQRLIREQNEENEQAAAQKPAPAEPVVTPTPVAPTAEPTVTPVQATPAQPTSSVAPKMEAVAAEGVIDLTPKAEEPKEPPISRDIYSVDEYSYLDQPLENPVDEIDKPKKKKSKGVLIAAIVAVGLLVAAAILILL